MNHIDDRESRLSQALAALNRADASEMGTSSRVQAVLMAEVRSRAAARRRSYLLTLATAASLALIVSVAVLWVRAAVLVSPVSQVVSREVVTDFLPLPYSGIPTRTTHLVRLEVPRQALASFGLGSFEAVDPAASSTVLADVLIGDDGLARAVRFVRSTSRQE
jgi:hypothetical protein